MISALFLLPFAPLLGLNKLVELQTLACSYVWSPMAKYMGCPYVRPAADREVVEEVGRVTRKAVEEALSKHAAIQTSRTTPPPLHEAFQVTPTWFRSDLTVSVRKVVTEAGGQLTIFACSRGSAKMHFVGETAYAAGQDNHILTARFAEPLATLLMQLQPSEGSPVSIVAPWNLETMARLKEPVSRPGLLNCTDVVGKF